MISAIIVSAVLLIGQHGGLPEQLPSDSCLTIAKTVVDHFQPAADTVAGRHVQIEVIGGTVPFPTALLSENRTVLAEVSFSGSIVIHSAWCDLEPKDKIVAITHEIGHLVDRSNNLWRFFSQLTYTVFLPWQDRPTEQRANEYGRQILNLVE